MGGANHPFSYRTHRAAPIPGHPAHYSDQVTDPIRVRVSLKHDGAQLGLCELSIKPTDASVYIRTAHADGGRYFWGHESFARGEQTKEIGFRANGSADQPKISIHESGQVHVKDSGGAYLAGPVRIPPLADLRGQHVATVTADDFSALPGHVPQPESPSLRELIITAAPEVLSGQSWRSTSMAIGPSFRTMSPRSSLCGRRGCRGHCMSASRRSRSALSARASMPRTRAPPWSSVSTHPWASTPGRICSTFEPYGKEAMVSGYRPPKQRLHREFLYLNHDTVLNSLSAIEAGKVDDDPKGERGERRRFDVSIGAGGVRGGGGREGCERRGATCEDAYPILGLRGLVRAPHPC